MMKRREFLKFFLMGGFLSLMSKKLFDKKITGDVKQKGKEAMFWRKKDEL